MRAALTKHEVIAQFGRATDIAAGQLGPSGDHWPRSS